jgi:fructokinase
MNFTPNAPGAAAISTADALYGAIEAGGTKFVVAVAHATGAILNQSRIETRDPAATLADVFDFFRAAERAAGAVEAFGVGSFGPLELRRGAPGYGFITNTPKPGWRNTDLLGTLQRSFARPVGFDTDVNAAALAELRWGGGRHLQSLAYVTVGTGIGGGMIHHGQPVHGLMHPEIGHVRVLRHPTDSLFAGVCPFHGDCLEGLASGPAILARTGRSLADTRPNDPIWGIEADYLGQLCAQLVLMHSPQRIFLGGGVMQHQRLYGEIADRMRHWLGGYLPHEELQSENYVVPPALGANVGVMGALALAVEAAAGFGAPG